MANTQWGSPITFGWELEGRNFEILHWYRPRHHIDGNAWMRMSLNDRIDQYDQIKSAVPALNWGDFVKVPTAPPYIADDLQQEVFDGTWEIRSTVYPTSVDALFSQISTVQNKLEANLASFQVHIVFKRPPSHDIHTHAQLAGLFRLLNDYAFAKVTHRGNHGFARLQGPYVTSIDVLKDDLMAARKLDGTDQHGASSGNYKYHYAGLRDLYGDQKIGFEIRGGWQRRPEKLQSLIERVTAQLGSLDTPFSVKHNRYVHASNFTLLKHYQFHQTMIPGIDDSLLANLMDEAERVWNKSKQDGLTQFSFPRSAHDLFHRWMLAFAPWEDHPSFRENDGRQRLIRSTRQAITMQLKNYFDGIKPEQPGGNTDYVSRTIQRFFRTTTIFGYL